MTTVGIFRLCAVSAIAVLAGCQNMDGFSLGKPKTETAEVSRSNSTHLVERDIEAPEVFQVSDAGLWDGRPSLGGVWVAHPDAVDPERVIIRNDKNGKFVIGALFRKERAVPGPSLQVSSEAAAALGLLAGQPADLDVTALRKEKVAETPDAIGALPAAADVQTSSLGDPVALQAAAAIDAAAPNPQPIPDATAGADTAVITKAAATTPATGAKTFVQIGFFSIEKNAIATGDKLRSKGIVPTIKAETVNGKKFWRVLVGPANSRADRAAVLKTVKAQGFSDAYFVTN